MNGKKMCSESSVMPRTDLAIVSIVNVLIGLVQGVEDKLELCSSMGCRPRSVHVFSCTGQNTVKG